MSQEIEKNEEAEKAVFANNLPQALLSRCHPGDIPVNTLDKIKFALTLHPPFEGFRPFMLFTDCSLTSHLQIRPDAPFEYLFDLSVFELMEAIKRDYLEIWVTVPRTKQEAKIGSKPLRFQLTDEDLLLVYMSYPLNYVGQIMPDSLSIIFHVNN